MTTTATIPRRVGRVPRPFNPWRLLLHVSFIAVLLLWVSPFVWMLASTFRPAVEAQRAPLALFSATPTLENLQRAWELGNFSRYFLNSLVVSLSTVVIVTLVTALAGFALGRRTFPGRLPLLALLGATLFLPQGYTVIPIYDLVGRLGLNNTLGGVTLALTGTGFVLYVFMFTAYFASLPRELEEAALVDGTNIFQMFLYVMLPLARPIIATVAILEFISSWNAFLLPLVLTFTRPELRTLGVGIYSFFGENPVDWTALAAAATLCLLPVILVFVLFQRAFVEGVAGAVKS
ncbi:sugar ABC transporter permease (plasmid) [Deinococcus aetherius]|uniref:Sugar ABC transporter permease n=1 Tax=Deinococcus aetherius TaxID=200252 RepID=A0ABN6RPH2_9DEIO|nr:carbohydrate ABC transporter permease [Deinococcus aetherius]BDP44316.1 sugar ABC transporter permease [Deinococcus aetherius]